MWPRLRCYPVTIHQRSVYGTGKELRRKRPTAGARNDGPLVAVNCAAIPEGLLESELFGHERGAFTGAVRTRAGRFELARGATLVLDEIGDMLLAMQAKILRALEERRIQRVAATGRSTSTCGSSPRRTRP